MATPRNEALWQEIARSRADGARAAYAQWLTAQGAADRAQLVTLQLQAASELGTASAQSWVSSARLEKDIRGLLKKHLPIWKKEERHDTAFYYKGFPARLALPAAIARAEAATKLRVNPVEHAIVRGAPAGLLDELHGAGVRALTIAGGHAAVMAALVKHPLLHQLAWLRAVDASCERALWESVEKAAPKALLYVDGRGVAIETEDDGDGDLELGVDGALLARPCWRTPRTTWGPVPTLGRILAVADAIRAGTTKTPKPGHYSPYVSLERDVERPAKTYAEVVAPEHWDPEKE